ncbi:MAG: pentapeptide repeat-containing protein [Rhodobacteraceae bacterium]|nr:pentapeptide repeat-containing protein [Paracoccaceae bacterium]
MANPQHLEWLLEGVEAWNARREREDFTPDLRGAGLGGADLRAANLSRADLGGANVKSVYSSTPASFVPVLEYTDLSHTLALSQEQLDKMDGDTGVILPEGLHHPAHWPDPERAGQAIEEALSLEEPIETRRQDPPSNFRRRVSFILEHPQLALASATYSANQIETAVAAYRSAKGSPNHLPPEMEAFMLISASFREIGRLLRDKKNLSDTIAEKDKLIAALGARVEELQERVVNLNMLLAGAPKESFAKKWIVPALTGAGGTLLASLVMFTGNHIHASASGELSSWAFSQPESSEPAEPERRPMPRPKDS